MGKVQITFFKIFKLNFKIGLTDVDGQIKFTFNSWIAIYYKNIYEYDFYKIA